MTFFLSAISRIFRYLNIREDLPTNLSKQQNQHNKHNKELWKRSECLVVCLNVDFQISKHRETMEKFNASEDLHPANEEEVLVRWVEDIVS